MTGERKTSPGGFDRGRAVQGAMLQPAQALEPSGSSPANTGHLPAQQLLLVLPAGQDQAPLGSQELGTEYHPVPHRMELGVKPLVSQLKKNPKT